MAARSVWPHSAVVHIGGSSICVGTDDAALVDHLRPWTVDERVADRDRRLDLRLVDFGVMLHPPTPATRAEPRVLPNLRHGTDVVARSRSVDAMRDAFLRTLGRFERADPTGSVRLRLTPIRTGGSVDLVPHAAVAMLGLRLEAVSSDSVAVDPATLMVHVDPLLGSSDRPDAVPLRRWFTQPVPHFDLETDHDGTLARLVAGTLSSGRVVAEPDSAGVLDALVHLHRRLAPERIPTDRSDFRSLLAPAKEPAP